jgi:tRNA-guanine transglycosylase
MISFRVTKQSSRSRARLGVLSTPHGDVETPAFVPVATRASTRLLESNRLAELGAQLIISNTFHLHITPGEDIVKEAGGVHSFMHWKKPVMTDSGGFQVFSMGFGTDHGVGKILKEAPDDKIGEGTQPTKIKITEDGVHFRSPRDGSPLFLGPRESIRIQEAIGADIMFAFDECPSPKSDEAYMRTSLAKTHRWAQVCLDARTGNQALYGIVQGGAYPHLRTESANIIGAMGFDGFGIGGEFGYDKESLRSMVTLVTDALPTEKPRHLLGVGHPEDFTYIMEGGADTFDCIAPTHYARHGVAFTSGGRVDLRKKEHERSFVALDESCECSVCTTYSRAYISHLVRSHELTGLLLLTEHNMFYLNTLARKLRERIASDEL